jgi:hypothetical protein
MTQERRRAFHWRRVGGRALAGALWAGCTVASLTRTAFATGTTNGGQAYLDECEAAGVPTPPPWNYEDAWHERPNSLWRRSGVVTPTFAGSSNQIAEAFYYESDSPLGVCIALPRSVFPAGQAPEDGPPERIDLLGVICQGVVSGKACFWDHGFQYVSGGISPFQTLDFGDGPLSTTFVGGAELVGPGNSNPGGICTNCHRGENVFIIHPASNLGLGIPNLMPQVGHDPIVPVGWPQNPGPTDLFSPTDTSSCLACHNGPIGGRFPAVSQQTESYCRILQNTFGTTMPFPNPTGNEERADFPPYDLLLDACGIPAPPGENPPEKMMSFDGPASEFWAADVGTLTDESSNFTQGTASMAVNAGGYVRLDGLPFRTWSVPMYGSEVELDVYVPPSQPEPYWFGSVALFINIPSAQLVNTFVGHVELTPCRPGWRTVSFTLPPQVRAALAEQHSNVRFGIAVNRPNDAPPVLLDNLRFAGTPFLPPSPPPLKVQYDFERGGQWEGRDGVVVATENSSEQAFLSSSSLKVSLDGSDAGRVWTVPGSSLTPGSAVNYRVYIPSGTPISAVQPYVEDANWVWSHSFNTNLPRDAWITLSVVVPEDAELPLNEIGVKFYLSEAHTGPVFLDAIQW